MQELNFFQGSEAGNFSSLDVTTGDDDKDTCTSNNYYNDNNDNNDNDNYTK